jgi:hypothetical protein
MLCVFVFQLMWYQDTILLDPTDRRKMESRGNKHTLNIRNVQGSDFGNYSCVADNSLGRAKKYMELSGRTIEPLGSYCVSLPGGSKQQLFSCTRVVLSSVYFSSVCE